MCQEAARRLLNRSYHFQVRKVASLLARPLSSHYPHISSLSDPVHNPYTHDRGHFTSSYSFVLYRSTCAGSLQMSVVLCGLISVGVHARFPVLSLFRRSGEREGVLGPRRSGVRLASSGLWLAMALKAARCSWVPRTPRASPA